MIDKQNLEIMERRQIMKAYDEEWVEPSDQAKGLEQPPLAKASYGTKLISLTKSFENIIHNNNFYDLLNTRTSKRVYTEEGITLEELSFLLWATQGVKQIAGKTSKATKRMVPSAGARHPIETYVLVNHVDGLENGLYHYLALEHKLELISVIENQTDRIIEAACGQPFLGKAAVDFIWSVVPYRSEWRYGIEAQKYSLLDTGHVCQNLYLASEAIGCGTCAIAAYDQKLMDALIGLDTEPSSEKEDEFVVYLASVGKVTKE